MVQMTFETFGCPATYVAPQALLSVYASENDTGLVMVSHGYVCEDNTQRLDLAGRDLTEYMVTSQNVGLRRGAKDAEESDTIDRTYELPDGNTISVGKGLFQPGFLGSEAKGIHVVSFNSIMKSDFCVRRSICGVTVLSGGTTMYEGIGERMIKEMTALAPSTKDEYDESGPAIVRKKCNHG